MGSAGDDKVLRDPLRSEAQRRAFVLAETAPGRAPLLPDMVLQLASDATPLWHATEATLAESEVSAPYWAFAWAGGQALARFVLDHPEVVRGRRVLDFAAGSGLVGIAAARAGAARVVCVDIDPCAVAACAINAERNGVAIEARSDDIVGAAPLVAPIGPVDVVLVGDVLYEREASEIFLRWLRALARLGTRVLIGDPGRGQVPHDVRVLQTYEVPVPRDLEGRDLYTGWILELAAG